MSSNTQRNATVIEELLKIIRSGENPQIIREQLDDYHENDIADALALLTKQERISLYSILGTERSAEILSYSDDAADYLSELRPQSAADILEDMDADDAVDVLEDVEPERREDLINLIDEEAKQDITLICSYSDDEIGSKMTTNYIEIEKDITVKQAMKSVFSKADENDNVSTIYVCDKDGKFYGAIDLKDLIIAIEYTPLESLVVTSYPTLHAHESISECIEELKDYAEDSIPVLDENDKIIGGVGIAEFDGLCDCAEIQKLYLDDSSKGKGYGKELMKIAENEARKSGYKQLYLETHSNLTAAIYLYEKSGFKQIDRPKETVHGKMDRFYLKKL